MIEPSRDVLTWSLHTIDGLVRLAEVRKGDGKRRKARRSQTRIDNLLCALPNQQAPTDPHTHKKEIPKAKKGRGGFRKRNVGHHYRLCAAIFHRCAYPKIHKIRNKRIQSEMSWENVLKFELIVIEFLFKNLLNGNCYFTTVNLKLVEISEPNYKYFQLFKHNLVPKSTHHAWF